MAIFLPRIRRPEGRQTQTLGDYLAELPIYSRVIYDQQAAREIRPRRPAAVAPVPVPVPVPPPPVTGGELFEDLLRKRTHVPTERGLPRGVPEWEDLLRRPSQNIPSPADAADDLERLLRRPLENRVLGAVARVGGLIAGVLYPTSLGDSDLGLRLPEDRRGQPNPRRPRPRTATGQQPPRVPPALPTGTDQTLGDSSPRPGRPTQPRVTIPDNPLPELPTSPANPTPQPRRPGPIPTGEPTAGTDPANPTLPSEWPVPLPTPTPLPSTRPSTLPDWLPFALPLVMPAPTTGARPSLPQPQPGTNPLSNPQPTTDRPRLSRPLTLPQPRPLPSQSPSGSDPCKCTRTGKPKRKRKPRDECWRGTYVETRRGLIKSRREKIRCQ